MSSIEIKRGDTAKYNIYFKDTNEDPIDITGYTVWFTVRRDEPASSVEDDSDADLAGEAIDQASFSAGLAVIEFSATDTTLDFGYYWYDIQYKKPDGTIYSSAAGEFIVSADITRSS